MKKNDSWHLVIFAGVILLLNLVFQLPIAIIGSLVLTIGMNLVFNLFQRRTA